MARQKKNDALKVRTNSFFDTFQTLEDKIRQRAYQLFEGRNGDEGDHMSDWLQAQSDVLTSIALELTEEDDRYVFSGEVPEVFEPTEIEIDVSDGMLSVGGTHRTEAKESSGEASSISSSEVNFMRRMSLPEDADIDSIDTAFDGKKLEVTVPKARR